MAIIVAVPHSRGPACCMSAPLSVICMKFVVIQNNLPIILPVPCQPLCAVLSGLTVCLLDVLLRVCVCE